MKPTVAHAGRVGMDRFFFFFQAEDGIRDLTVTGVQTCALPISVEEPHDELRHERLGREGATRPRAPEVREVPALRHQTVETARVSEDALDSIDRKSVV